MKANIELYKCIGFVEIIARKAVVKGTMERELMRAPSVEATFSSRDKRPNLSNKSVG